MRVFVDTSAFLSLLNANEQHHSNAQRVWFELVKNDAVFVCTNYILVETVALIQNRLGLTVLNVFQENIVPFLQVIWVDDGLHQAGVTAVLAANRRHLSLVDCTSFAAMRQSGLDTTFAFDQHFAEQGFNVLS